MAGLLNDRMTVWVRRLTYSLLLAGGLIGLLGLMIADLRVPLVGGAVPAMAETGTGGLRTLTSGKYMDGFAAWAPDGKRLAFMRDGRVWIVGADGAKARAVTKGDIGWDAAPVWRPGGRMLAFIRLGGEGKAAEIIAVDAGSGKQTVLIREQGPVGYLAWAPDGESLYYSTDQDLIRLDLSSRKRQHLFAVHAGWELISGGLTVSPDGKRLVFGSGPRDGHGVVYDLWMLTLPTRGAEPERLTTGGAIMPAFDATGKRLAYRSPRRATGVYVMDLSTREARKVMADTQQAMYFHPAFSPDGKTLALSGLRLDEGTSAQEPARLISHIYLLPL